MATETKTKICRDCGSSKPLTDYYKHKATTYRAICKLCFKIKRRQYPNNSAYVPRTRTNGFVRLPIDTQRSIKLDLTTMISKEVATKYNLNKSTLNTWKRRGYIQALTT